MQKTAYDMLNDMYMEKEAAGWIGTAAKAIGSFAKSNTGKMIGAGIKNGASQGALYGFMSGGGTDANGNKQSRIGSTIKGALTGGMLGGAASGVGAAATNPAFKSTVGNIGNKINEWGKTNMPKLYPGKLATASEELEELYTEKLAGAGLTMGATGGALAGIMSGASKGYAKGYAKGGLKGGITGAIGSGIKKGTAGMLMGAGAGALLDRISSPRQGQEQDPNRTQNFNG